MELEIGSYDEEVEYGLRTPVGEVIWPPETYRDYQFETEEQRAALPHILLQGAAEMRLDPHQFVAGFSWVSRIRMTTVVYRTLPSETSLISSIQAAVGNHLSTPNDGEAIAVSQEGES